MKTITTTFIALITSMFFATSAIAAICGGTPCVNSADVIDGSLLSKDLAPKTVSGVQIRDGAVFPNKLSAGAKPSGANGDFLASGVNIVAGGTTVRQVTIVAPAPGFVVASFSAVCQKFQCSMPV